MLFVPHPTFRDAYGDVDISLVVQCCDHVASGWQIPKGHLCIEDYGTLRAEQHCQAYMQDVISAIDHGCTVTRLSLIGHTLRDAGMIPLISALEKKRSCIRSLTMTHSLLSVRSVDAVCYAIANHTWCVSELDLSYNIFPKEDYVRVVRSTLSPLSHLTTLTIYIFNTRPDEKNDCIHRIVEFLRTGRSSLRRMIWKFGSPAYELFNAKMRQLIHSGRTSLVDMDFQRESRASVVQPALLLNRRRVLYRRIALRIRLWPFHHG